MEPIVAKKRKGSPKESIQSKKSKPTASLPRHNKLRKGSAFYVQTSNASRMLSTLRALQQIVKEGELVLACDANGILLHVQDRECTVFAWFLFPREFFDDYTIQEQAMQQIGHIYVEGASFYAYIDSIKKSDWMYIRVDSNNAAAKLYIASNDSNRDIPLREGGLQFIPMPNHSDIADQIVATVKISVKKLNELIDKILQQKYDVVCLRIDAKQFSIGGNSRIKGNVSNTLPISELESCVIHRGTVSESQIDKKALTNAKINTAFGNEIVTLDFLETCILQTMDSDLQYMLALPIKVDTDEF